MAVKYDQQSVNAARIVLDHPVVDDILSSMELDAINAAVDAKLTDAETPAAYLAEVRAIRNFRNNLRQLVQLGEARLKREPGLK
jgi:hypothetical protein